MAVLRGFDVVTGSTTDLTAPPPLGTLLAGISVPSGYVVAALDLTASELDPGGTLMLSVGDPADTDRHLAANAVAQDGGTLEVRPDPRDWYRYATRKTVSARVSTAATAATMSGAVTLVLYTYPALTFGRLKYRVLEELGVLAEGATPRAADDVQAEEALQSVYDQLRYKGMSARLDLAWPLELTPTWAAPHVAVLAAVERAGVYGLSLPRRQMIEAKAQQAMRELAKQHTTKTLYEPVEATFY